MHTPSVTLLTCMNFTDFCDGETDPSTSTNTGAKGERSSRY